MSEWRMPELTHSVRANRFGNKSFKLAIYRAESWRKLSRHSFKKFHPRNGHRVDQWNGMFRVRVNDKWVMVEGKQYSFFTKAEVDEMVANMSSEALS